MKRNGFARRLRRDTTDAEKLLWSRLRDRRTRGLKFRRQVPIAGFIADFACVEVRLIIELDGSQYARIRARDAAKTAAIETAGYVVVRFWDNDVLSNIDSILDEIDRNAARNP